MVWLDVISFFYIISESLVSRAFLSVFCIWFISIKEASFMEKGLTFRPSLLDYSTSMRMLDDLGVMTGSSTVRIPLVSLALIDASSTSGNMIDRFIRIWVLS